MSPATTVSSRSAVRRPAPSSPSHPDRAVLPVPVPVPVPVAALALLGLLSACVPPGNSTPSDAGVGRPPAASSTAAVVRPSPNVMTAPFEDTFDRAPGAPSGGAQPGPDGGAAPAPSASAAPGSSASAAPASPADAGPPLGPSWAQAGTEVWHIENGRVCGANAHNHGLWLQRTLPVNARIEFDAVSDEADGDLKAEIWGDGRSGATGISYTNATSYLTIFGGWHNKFHVLARLNEHGTDRKQVVVDKDSDDPVQKPVTAGQVYHFKIERTDGKTVHWSVNGVEYLAYADPAPLAGLGHDHFGFNDWEAKVCFDNVKVTPLP